MTEALITLAAIVGAAVVAVLANWNGKRIGKKEAQYHATEADRKRALDLRKLGERVRRDEQRFRD